jgi:hypothetical protein
MDTRGVPRTSVAALCCLLYCLVPPVFSSAFANAVFEKVVVSGADDAEENVATKVVSLRSATLDLIRDRADQLVGLRFANIALSNKDFVASAYIQFTAGANLNADTGSLWIKGQAVDNAAAFSTAPGNVSARSRTNESVTWDPPAWSIVGAAGMSQRTNDLSAIIQEIISRPGWKAQNALVFVIGGTSGYRRVAKAFDGSVVGAARLHIEYLSANYGHLHNHTGYSDGVGTPDQHYADAKRSGLDFLGLADHSSALSSAEWATLKTAAINNTSSTFVALHGFEWTSATAGHIVISNSADYTNASSPATDSFAEFMTWLSGRPDAAAIYNHPGNIAASALCQVFSTTASAKLIGIELWNRDNGFSQFYDGDGCSAGDGRKGYFDEALQRGWKIGAAGGRDMHKEFVYTATSRNYADAHYPYRIGVWIASLNRAPLVAAFQQKVIFSTLDSDLRLWFGLDGKPMGSVVGAGTRSAVIYALDSSAPDDRLSVVELVKGTRTSAPLVVKAWYPSSRSFRVKLSVTGKAGDYFYVRVTEVDGGRAISSPIWFQ